MVAVSPYGLMAGIGLGLGYIVPVATLVKWFPDKRGMITGIAVAGFGAGALITAPVATVLIRQVGVAQTFAILGVVYLVAVTGAGYFMQNPPRAIGPPGGRRPQVSRRAGPRKPSRSRKQSGAGNGTDCGCSSFSTRPRESRLSLKQLR